MEYQEQYPPGYHPRAQPHFNLYLPQLQNPYRNPNPSFDHHHQYHSSFHAVAPIPPPIAPEPLRPAEPIYPDNHGGGYASQATIHGGDYNAQTGGLPSYYHDPKWPSNAPFEDHRNNPVGFTNPIRNTLPTNADVAADYYPNSRTTQKIRHQGKISARKSLKKIKIPQSVRCDVCKIVCDTEDVLKKHRIGKKHKQNLDKLKALVAGEAISATNSAVPAPEAPDTSKSPNGRSKKKKASQKAEDLETKKKRVLEGGAAMDAVRTCSICNIVCNSETVYQYHLAGQKHAAMVKKQASGVATQIA